MPRNTETEVQEQEEDQPWLPAISHKQLTISRATERLLLLSGPRKATKTIGGVHAVASHMWNTDRANVSFLAKTTTSSYDGGAWKDLVDAVTQWVDADFGMEWYTKPRPDGVTHKLYFEVTNNHGTVSRCQLDSLDNENEVESKYKNKRYSMIYASEMSHVLKKQESFTAMEESLRCLHLTAEQHQFIGDTNPDTDLGEASWIYQYWFVFKHQTEFDPSLDAEQVAALRSIQKDIRVIEFTLDDNIWMTDLEKAKQKAKYLYNPAIYAAYVDGKWVKATGGGIFSPSFRPLVHVVGEIETPANPDPDILVPEANCSTLSSGSDIGSSNHSVHFGEKTFRIEFDQEGKTVERSVFKVLDEIVIIGELTGIPTLVSMWLEKMDSIESLCGGSIHWTHWSDRSAFDKGSNRTETFEYQDVYRESRGRIELLASFKRTGSVQARVNLLAKLLKEDRIYISASCEKTIEMLNNLKKGKTYALDPRSKYKHVFDSLTYWLCMECMDEMEKENELLTSKRVAERKGQIIVWR